VANLAEAVDVSRRYKHNVERDFYVQLYLRTDNVFQTSLHHSSGAHVGILWTSRCTDTITLRYCSPQHSSSPQPDWQTCRSETVLCSSTCCTSPHCTPATQDGPLGQLRGRDSEPTTALIFVYLGSSRQFWISAAVALQGCQESSSLGSTGHTEPPRLFPSRRSSAFVYTNSLLKGCAANHSSGWCTSNKNGRKSGRQRICRCTHSFACIVLAPIVKLNRCVAVLKVVPFDVVAPASPDHDSSLYGFKSVVVYCITTHLIVKILCRQNRVSLKLSSSQFENEQRE
jgi:hypothetical protein